ncbi:Holin of 3TMs, for gene-transfer release [uncultured Caudovirales phage]|uniref:Holin of 3TMs, for gene-transfer release n=1 Tax=uncultured Caudovirales phage TaxID=2100421 RepID=A0A6J5PPR6_9CAUD|nr:Holin of 3TMs, for gene-transfer release [uncultured Caudovirales phage]CAB4185490.1 Holin of 3TMs, for gene-transfer release [uncultured Caudovirales phage]CAB4193366.1 Holin of 3TMs, for gene-transfer release [uncultured Caudovirales phage]CAB4216123.1 Holin of 3TMs, for gene-transfer release [uncultured Caudovirales phage]CAB5230757.1 Holin of 3TMs, for gene-transfer release [uncultured Caudovirales phage]
MAQKEPEDWMQKKWRPAMGWIYMVTCTTDFIIFPVLWSILQAALKQPITAWQPITLQGAGLYHLAMGAIIGVSAFGRTQEKISGTNIRGQDNSFAPSTSRSPGSSRFGKVVPTQNDPIL